MKIRVNFIERKVTDSLSIERVFRQIAKNLSQKNVEVKFEKMPFENSAFDTIKNLLFFRKSVADIYHITGHVNYISLLLPKDSTVLTVHDLGILHTRTGLRRYILKKLLFDWPVQRLKYITTVSETTRRELIHHTNCPGEKVRVIENPVQDKYSGQAKIFNAECPTILQIGTAPHKNLKGLITAIKGLECRLTIIGDLDDEHLRLLADNKIDYANRSGLNESGMREEYANCDLVSFCSTYEGFGLPIIEGQAMQRPVLTSNISPMKEVAGDGAVLADPHDTESIRAGIMKIIKDETFRNELLARGTENVKRFSAEHIADLYYGLYEQILMEKTI